MANNKQPHKNIKAAPAKTVKPQSAITTDNKQWWLLLIAVGITLVVFLPSLRNGFVTNWDDNRYIHNYDPIKALNWANIKIIFSTYHQGNYHPLTILTYAFEYAAVGLKPFLYHFDNLILHLLNVVLVFFFTKKLTQKLEIACITALLFGIHPMHVESVAWVSERKDVLYTFFFMFAAIFYIDYLQKPKAQARNFALSLVFFVIALLSKPAAVCFPGVVIAIDWFLQRKLSTKLFLEKIPFFLISIIFGIVAIYAQKDIGAIQDLGPLFSFLDRILLSFYAIMQYLSKLVFPIGLSAMHPYPVLVNGHLATKIYIAPLIVLALLVPLYLSYRKTRIFIFGAAFFMVNIAMVLQLLPVGAAIIAERYSYVPYIGLFMMVGYGYCWIADNKNEKISRFKTAAIAVLALWTIFFGVATFNRIKVWMRGDYLFEDILLQYKNQPFVYNNLGYLYFNELKEPEKALINYNQCIAIDSTFEMAYCNRGILHFNIQKYPEAVSDFDHSLRYNPTNTDALLGRANTLSTLKQFDKSVTDYNNYIKQIANNASAYLWRGIAFNHTSKLDQAIADFTTTIQMQPNNYEPYYWRGLTYYSKNMDAEAISDLSKALEIVPSRGDIYANRGMIYYATKNLNASIADYSKALTLNPQDVTTLINRSISYAESKQWKNAFADIDQAGKMGYPIDKNFYENVKRNAMAR